MTTNINRFALVLLLLVFLELALLNHQVESVKSLKTKLALKKIKKFLPFWALFKPKKKLLLIPIPIPIKNSGIRPRPSSPMTAQPLMPSSFVMLDATQNPALTMMPMTIGPDMTKYRTNSSMVPLDMMIPIQSNPNIEFITNMMPTNFNRNSTSGSLIQMQNNRGQTKRLRDNQYSIEQQQHVEQVYEPDNHFYYRPHHTKQAPRSPAKLLRGKSPQEYGNLNEPRHPIANMKSSQRHPIASPIIIVSNQWRPTASKSTTVQPFIGQQPIEMEEIVSMGPPHLMPVYQTPNGQLHMTPPTVSPRAQSSTERPSVGSTSMKSEHEKLFEMGAESSGQNQGSNLDDEVRVVGGSSERVSSVRESTETQRRGRLNPRSKTLVSSGY